MVFREGENAVATEEGGGRLDDREAQARVRLAAVAGIFPPEPFAELVEVRAVQIWRGIRNGQLRGRRSEFDGAAAWLTLRLSSVGSNIKGTSPH